MKFDINNYAKNDLPFGSCSYIDASNDNRTHTFYEKWLSMFKRCYDVKFHASHSYNDVTVCEEWKLLSEFYKWYESQYKEEGWYLDKDILVAGSKEYSPDTTRLVPRMLNELIKPNHINGETTGTTTRIYRNKSKGILYKTPRITMKLTHIDINGNKVNINKDYPSVIEAHNAWRLAKADVIEQVVEDTWKLYPKLDITIKDALLLRANKLRNFDLKIEDFY